MTKSLAMEWSVADCGSTCSAPATRLTPMNRRPEVAEQVKIFERDTPMGRIATPEEMVGPSRVPGQPRGLF